MGTFFSTEFWMSEDDKIAEMLPEEKELYMKCNYRRIAHRKYYKEHPDEWYDQYYY